MSVASDRDEQRDASGAGEPRELVAEAAGRRPAGTRAGSDGDAVGDEAVDEVALERPVSGGEGTEEGEDHERGDDRPAEPSRAVRRADVRPPSRGRARASLPCRSRETR